MWQKQAKYHFEKWKMTTKSKCKYFAETHPIETLLLEHRQCSAGGMLAAWQHQMLKTLVFQGLLL